MAVLYSIVVGSLGVQSGYLAGHVSEHQVVDVLGDTGGSFLGLAKALLRFLPGAATNEAPPPLGASRREASASTGGHLPWKPTRRRYCEYTIIGGPVCLPSQELHVLPLHIQRDWHGRDEVLVRVVRDVRRKAGPTPLQGLNIRPLRLRIRDALPPGDALLHVLIVDAPRATVVSFAAPPPPLTRLLPNKPVGQPSVVPRAPALLPSEVLTQAVRGDPKVDEVHRAG
eukprot:scaffold1541_cov256-Pinguiococcus_pyrenoidosus.AAC.39